MKWAKILLILIPILALAIYIGLPMLLTSMGLHPHYNIPDYDLTGSRALIVTTSRDRLGDTGRSTGVFASELTVPYYAFLDAGMTVDIASIKGGAIPVEPWSMGWPLATAEDRRFRRDEEAMAKLMSSAAITEINADDYDVVFLSGGWGAAYDLAQSPALAELVSKANANGAILGAVCHGVLGLLNAKDENGAPLLAGRRVTGVTDKQIEELGIQITPKHPETELRAVNAVFQAETSWRDFFATKTIVDGNIVTGQNQNSGYETSHRILELLAAE